MANNFDYGMAFGNHLVHETSKLCYADRVVQQIINLSRVDTNEVSL